MRTSEKVESTYEVSAMILLRTGVRICERPGPLLVRQKQCSALFQIKLSSVLLPTPSTSAPSSRRLTKAQAGSCNSDGVSWAVAIPRVPEEASNYSNNENISKTHWCLFESQQVEQWGL